MIVVGLKFERYRTQLLILNYRRRPAFFTETRVLPQQMLNGIPPERPVGSTNTVP